MQSEQQVGKEQGRVSKKRGQDAKPTSDEAKTKSNTTGNSNGAKIVMGAAQAADLFRRWGYLQADLDPFGRLKPFLHRDLQTLSGDEAEQFKKIYSSKIGVEFMHMPFPDRCEWIAERMEGERPEIDRDYVLKRLLCTEMLEKFLYTRYVGMKWFSLDGVAALVPLIDTVLERAADAGVEIVLLGMAHRGRINVLNQIAGAELANIFAAFEDVDPKSALGGGDVKYHYGATGIYTTRTGKELRVHLVSNPSHLEAVDPVLMGRTKARQDRLGDKDGTKVLALLMHGDAAFAGQGVAAESLNFAELPGFNIGGTVHIIINNLIGFTATPEVLHSSRYATDIAKRLSIPIFHVNAGSIEDVVFVGKMAADYRTEYKNDVVVDLIGYRRHGHNETDDPTTMAPVVYEKIKNRPQDYQLYAKEIGLSDEVLKGLEEERLKILKEEQERGRAMTKKPKFFSLPDYWSRYIGGPYSKSFEVDTSITPEVLQKVAERVTNVPEGFNIHRKMRQLLDQRAAMARGEKPIDWGMGELLAYGSLLLDGVPVRLTGQDSRRGTFSHRYSVLIDVEHETEYSPLKDISETAKFQVYDSMLSELAAVGFEYGYSRDFPEALVLWEAQFGDFVNGAQIIIDQFIAAGEDKWGLLSGVVMLLPHGYEGGGAEHSSARLERFLQLCGEDNIQVCYPSTVAQHFHLLRRQALRIWRKPLIVCTPKSMLRAPYAAASLDQLTHGRFENVIDDSADYHAADRILLCSGKIVHDLRAERKRRNDTSTAIVAIEQLYPFPEQEIAATLAQYPGTASIVWVQEEPANMGALFYIKPRLEMLSGKRVSAVRRSESASPATGSAKAHTMEQQALLNLAFAKHY